MAGSRSYYSNVLTTTRGSVRVTAQIQLNGASQPTIIAGRGVTATHTGGSNDCTVTFPEKFGKCTWLSPEYLPQSGHSASFAGFFGGAGTNYNPVTGQAKFVIGYLNGATVNSTAADNDPVGILYVEAEFELGM